MILDWESMSGIQSLCVERGIPWTKDAPLRERCSFRIGGAAALLAEPCCEEEIALLAGAARGRGIPLVILGKGSNILFADEGFGGLVIVLGPAFARMGAEPGGMVFCEAGATLNSLCRFAMEQGLSGLEFAYGIPGTVGGAVYMNAGAYGGEVKDVLQSARHLEPDGSPGELGREALELSYRHSVYTDSDRIITGAVFALEPGDREEIRARMEDYMDRRRSKQPLEYPSAGSTFKRPAGDYASALIDRCGLKGCRVGGAQVSEKHAGFVINRDGATSADVQALIRHVRDEVQRQTGVVLEPEVKIL